MNPRTVSNAAVRPGLSAAMGVIRLALLSCLALTLKSAWQPALASAPACNPGDPKQVRLDVNVSGMHNTKGVVTVTIYPDLPKHFLDGKYKVARQTIPVMMPITHFCFALAEPGKYAVALFQDENDNGHFDTTFLGLPAEGFGFSNNPTLYLGPPKLSQVLVPVHAGDNAVSVKMKYY